MQELHGQWVAPGDRLGQASQFGAVGAGCYVRGNHVHASIVGMCEITALDAGSAAKAADKAAAAALPSVSVSAPYAEPPVVPDVGNIVTAKVSAVAPRPTISCSAQSGSLTRDVSPCVPGCEHHATGGSSVHRVCRRNGAEGEVLWRRAP